MMFSRKNISKADVSSLNIKQERMCGLCDRKMACLVRILIRMLLAVLINNMPCDLELFASLLTSILLFILATPIRYLTRSLDMLFDKSWVAIPSILYVAQSSLMTWHTLEWQIYIRQCHTMLVCIVNGGWLLERE